MPCILKAMSINLPLDILTTINNLNDISDTIVEILLSSGEIPVPFECGKAWIHTTPDKLASPDCIPGIISLVSFTGMIEGQALVLYAMDKYMVVNSNISFGEGSDPWYQARRHFMSRGFDHAEYKTSIPSISPTLHYNHKFRMFDQAISIPNYVRPYPIL